jgi:hypothetical protein
MSCHPEARRGWSGRRTPVLRLIQARGAGARATPPAAEPKWDRGAAVAAALFRSLSARRLAQRCFSFSASHIRRKRSLRDRRLPTPGVCASPVGAGLAFRSASFRPPSYPNCCSLAPYRGCGGRRRTPELNRSTGRVRRQPANPWACPIPCHEMRCGPRGRSRKSSGRTVQSSGW